MDEIIINCDLGEGIGNEEQLMPYIQSCNIACGGHAGNRETIEKVVELAVQNNVAIGAHPSYPDKENFGRVSLSISEEQLINSIQQQLNLFQEVLTKKGASLHHIKPHGALYNDIAKDEDLAMTFLKAIGDYKNEMGIYVPYKSKIARKALQNGFRIFYEAFADRAYNDDLSLVSRTLPNAILTNKEEVLKQVLHIAKNDSVVTINNKIVATDASTFCVHSDTENAQEIVEFLYNNIQTATIG
ncbi:MULTISPECIES: 5-oxoprolinase subunit PxpA [Galbibacter]|uniref:Putative lactam utilization protein B-like protein n=1 Tax=Galbibacter orientalis DSM 19592 TaxID=926559 RepID=I3C9Z9_9FLAO|nr:5-oxoprolinase subunit PxpA [Galbibacter orientalis]EIJ40442.1 putative lactam utilization protein B-like protein [Galbibacter orientalis DSM 19592]